jgi:hypothetical protein
LETAFVIRRNTQDPAYWEEFRVTEQDLEHLGNVLVEREIPLPLDELAKALVAFRCQREENQITEELSRGTLYVPKSSYQVGEDIVFPLFEYAVGTAVDVRDGHNPEHGQFQVVRVKFATGKFREFAAQLAEHPLNETAQVVQEDLIPPDALYQEYGPYVRSALVAALEAELGFIRLAGEWFLRDLLAEINEGHLNLAEAVLDMANGGPLPTGSLIGELDLAKEVKPQLAIFSLNYALQEDERFDEVGPAGEVLWYLRRLEPAEVLEPPELLRPKGGEYDARLLDENMFDLERQLDDEWSDLVAPPETDEPVALVLTGPHVRAGTLPITSRLARVFPTGRTHRIRFRFRDADTGEELEGWVVRERRFVYGLKQWYQHHEIPVGACLEVSRSDEPGLVHIRRFAQRTRRDWLRIATVVNDRLSFEMGRFPISCRVDDQMVIAMEQLDTLDTVVERIRENDLTLKAVVAETFPELAKLSPQGMVHASTLYSAVNMVLRTPPGPILASLVEDERFIPMGDNYWGSRSRGIGF